MRKNQTPLYETNGGQLWVEEGGYRVVIGNISRRSSTRTTLLVRLDGAMIDASGAKVTRSDIGIVEDFLEAAGVSGEVGNLYQGEFPEL